MTTENVPTKAKIENKLVPKSVVCEPTNEELSYLKKLKNWVTGKTNITKEEVIKAMPSQSI